MLQVARVIIVGLCLAAPAGPQQLLSDTRSEQEPSGAMLTSLSSALETLPGGGFGYAAPAPGAMQRRARRQPLTA